MITYSHVHFLIIYIVFHPCSRRHIHELVTLQTHLKAVYMHVNRDVTEIRPIDWRGGDGPEIRPGKSAESAGAW